MSDNRRVRVRWTETTTYEADIEIDYDEVSEDEEHEHIAEVLAELPDVERREVGCLDEIDSVTELDASGVPVSL